MNRYKQSWEERIKSKPGYKILAVVLLLIIIGYSVSHKKDSLPIMLPSHKTFPQESYDRILQKIQQPPP